MKKFILILFNFFCITGWSQIQYHLANPFFGLNPSFVELYSCCQLNHYDQEAMDYFLMSTPQIKDEVIDSISTELVGGSEGPYALKYYPRDSSRLYDSKKIYLPDGTLWQETQWNYDSMNRTTSQHRFNYLSNELEGYREYEYNSDGLVSKIYFGKDTAQIDPCISWLWGLANYYYTGFTLDSMQIASPDGTVWAIVAPYYSGSLIDSVKFRTIPVGLSQPNSSTSYYQYNSNGALVKDSLYSINWA